MTTAPLIRAAIAAAAALAVLLAAAVPSGADPVDDIFGSTTTTESDSDDTSTSSSTTSSTSVPEPDDTTTTTESSTSSSTSSTSSSTTTTAPGTSRSGPEPGGDDLVVEPDPAPVPGGDGSPGLDEAVDSDLEIPEWAAEEIAAVERSAPNSTASVLEALGVLASFGFTPREIAMIGLGSFPVRGEATFVDDWKFPRFTPDFHLHEGTDVFADFGTPITAPVDGVLTMGSGSVGGKYTYLTQDDGTYYYFAHLDSLPEPPDDRRIADPAEAARYHFRGGDRPVAYRVEAGDVIGTVGNTGNATGGPAHLHMEIHDPAGEAVNPKPILDGWLAEAEARVGEVIDLYARRGPRALVTTQRTRASGSGPFSAPTRPFSAEMLGMSSAGAGEGVEIVTEAVTRAVARIDWERLGSGIDRPLEEVAAVLDRALAGEPEADGSPNR